MNYNGARYYYIKNTQNDIVGILDNNLNQIVRYEYGSWGKITSIKDANGNEITSSTHIGKINPYKYRSYRYDEETGLYYLNSRYYNSEWGRFINADGQLNNTILGSNLYAYCENNPVNMIDPDGNFSISALINTIVNVAQKVVSQIATIVKTNNSKVTSSTTTQKMNSINTSINPSSSRPNNNILLSNRKPGKTPPGKWPTLPKNLGGKKPSWNPRGYYDGKYGETTWDSHSHGSGVDRGNGAQDGPWDTETGGRFNREGGQIIATGIGIGIVGYGIYSVAKWAIAIGGVLATIV